MENIDIFKPVDSARKFQNYYSRLYLNKKPKPSIRDKFLSYSKQFYARHFDFVAMFALFDDGDALLLFQVNVVLKDITHKSVNKQRLKERLKLYFRGKLKVGKLLQCCQSILYKRDWVFDFSDFTIPFHKRKWISTYLLNSRQYNRRRKIYQSRNFYFVKDPKHVYSIPEQIRNIMDYDPSKSQEYKGSCFTETIQNISKKLSKYSNGLPSMIYVFQITFNKWNSRCKQLYDQSPEKPPKPPKCFYYVGKSLNGLDRIYGGTTQHHNQARNVYINPKLLTSTSMVDIAFSCALYDGSVYWKCFIFSVSEKNLKEAEKIVIQYMKDQNPRQCLNINS